MGCGTKENVLIKFLPIILICHNGISPSKCNEELAINKVELDQMQNSPISCLMEGQSKAATLAFVPKEDEPFYVKIKCVPKETNG